MKGSDAHVGEGLTEWPGGPGCGPQAADCTPLTYVIAVSFTIFIACYQVHRISWVA